MGWDGKTQGRQMGMTDEGGKWRGSGFRSSAFLLIKYHSAAVPLFVVVVHIFPYYNISDDDGTIVGRDSVRHEIGVKAVKVE